jgi:hypothetical protein
MIAPVTSIDIPENHDGIHNSNNKTHTIDAVSAVAVPKKGTSCRKPNKATPKSKRTSLSEMLQRRRR